VAADREGEADMTQGEARCGPIECAHRGRRKIEFQWSPPEIAQIITPWVG